MSIRRGTGAAGGPTAKTGFRTEAAHEWVERARTPRTVIQTHARQAGQGRAAAIQRSQ